MSYFKKIITQIFCDHLKSIQLIISEYHDKKKTKSIFSNTVQNLKRWW